MSGYLRHPNNSPLITQLQAVSQKLSLVIILIPSMVICGWVFNIPFLKGILPNLPTMKVNTAVCFILGGGYLWLSSVKFNRNTKQKKNKIKSIKFFLALLLIVIPLLTLIQYGFNINLGIDELLMKQPEAPGSVAAPGRMAPNTALAFLLEGLAFLLFNLPHPRYLAAQIMAIGTWLLGFLGVLGYLYHTTYFYTAGSFTGMAIHTAISLLILSLGTLFTCPNRGIMILITSDSAGSLTIRQILLIVLILPPLVEGLSELGYRLYIYSKDAQSAVESILNIILFSGLLLWNAYKINCFDSQRQQAQIELEQANIRLQAELSNRQSAEAALQVSQERFSGILEVANDGIISVDKDYHIILFNQGAEKIFGYQSSEVIGQSLDLLLPIRFTIAHHQHITNFGQSGGKARKMGERQEIFGLHKDGTEFPAEASISKLEIGDEILFTAFLRDISDRKRIELELLSTSKRLQYLVTASTLVIFSCKPESEYGATFVSDNVKEILGYEVEDFLEESTFWLNHVHPDERTKVFDNLFKICEEKYYTNEYRFLHGDGTYHWVYEQIRLVTDDRGKPIEFVGFLADISGRKQVELELQQAKEAAEVANKAKSIFIANMSHELRTPLNAILGFTQVMIRDSSLTQKQRENLEIIKKSGDYLLTLINDILDLSKIEAGGTTLDENSFDLIDQLHSIQTMFHQKAEAKGLQLHLEIAPDVPQYIKTDPNKLRQVLVNLLGNAIKFTEKGSITLRLKNQTSNLTKREDNSPSDTYYLQFEVCDTGVGIAPSEIQTIFNAFTQTQAGKMSPEGTGLGLTISRKFVQLMGGDINVISTLGQGSTFSFEIPISYALATDIKPTQPHRQVIGLAPNQPPYRIVVADDQLENRQLLMTLLTQLGLEVREAKNGEEAVALWQEWQPHLIWMDMRMPVMDGCEATQQIRASIAGETVVIIALTAQASKSDRTLALSAGCNDFLSKPFQEDALFAKMEKYLGLQYIYAKTNQHSPTSQKSIEENQTKAITGESLSVMPREWMEKLHQATQLCDDEEIMNLIEQIPPEYTYLIADLSKITRDFQFQLIIKLVEDAFNSLS
ncbi:MAG TPA: hypothetical protein DEG17_04125 [Cyanobacteria bacterium UBA11149]|nr:hypothetical protein [Cyanobacteria bacterium UBA11366]HBK65367.1 hypothetical protein [Cyanobacteria bacterium UBA11166]HBR75055.1 hypothetical protein [Cyanobacteria bacterium UBA11159]HBS68049.1 hypothetical protein [Cyanobacteria bacterium UBA11153]HBW88078.1 hypothetical protein [Cyanobacteria bacterium UBA11149]